MTARGGGFSFQRLSTTDSKELRLTTGPLEQAIELVLECGRMSHEPGGYQEALDLNMVMESLS